MYCKVYWVSLINVGLFECSEVAVSIKVCLGMVTKKTFVDTCIA